MGAKWIILAILSQILVENSSGSRNVGGTTSMKSHCGPILRYTGERIGSHPPLAFTKQKYYVVKVSPGGLLGCRGPAGQSCVE